MSQMTPSDLLLAVTELTSAGGPAVATGDAISAWLAQNGIDPGIGMTPVNKWWWKADHANAPAPLRKFKIQRRNWAAATGAPPCTGRGENGWCLIERWDDACHWAAMQTPVWRAIPWCTTCSNWIFECSALVQRGTPLAGFDARVLRACTFGPASHRAHP